MEPVLPRGWQAITLQFTPRACYRTQRCLPRTSTASPLAPAPAPTLSYWGNEKGKSVLAIVKD